ncbi:hemerythrin domain-containing protein [Pacificimonas flava]|uniref:Hemerythrin-like domain-containing protein n=1 Tax=Pacificimonas flava TaxID=1234595 RepID=M2U3U6_9SPHN|nr:hemerythrin domain-containing protein [Pacificimonas flava]EMD82643.1 hypothetical protein C725_2030 [Pacificimonas flava]MBB5281468.1 hemerythrin-like domain-containing protein [Pacificimonas flava]
MADIFDLLKQDHDKHRDLLRKLTDTQGDSDERKALFKAFAEDAVAHAKAEEQSLYAAMLNDPDLSDEGSHSTAEHKEIEDYIEELQDTDMSSPGWIATFKKLNHRYHHHIDEEEEETFAAAKEKFSEQKREELGEKFSKRKPAEKKEQEDAA